jgi:hypothetical protein
MFELKSGTVQIKKMRLQNGRLLIFPVLPRFGVILDGIRLSAIFPASK